MYLRDMCYGLSLLSICNTDPLDTTHANGTMSLDCANYPSPANATTAPPALWPAEVANPQVSDPKRPARACLSHPIFYVRLCCTRHAQSGVPVDTCGWNGCVSAATDEEWKKCFEEVNDAHEYYNNTMVSEDGKPPLPTLNTDYSFNCVSFAEAEAGAKEPAKSGAQRAVLGATAFAIACSVLTVAN